MKVPKIVTTAIEKAPEDFYTQACQRKQRFVVWFEEKSSGALQATEMLKYAQHVFSEESNPKAKPDKDGFTPYSSIYMHPWQMGESIMYP